jgi:hypothetical protein
MVRVKANNSEKNLSQCHLVTTNLAWTDPGPNSALSGERPWTDRPSYCTEYLLTLHSIEWDEKINLNTEYIFERMWPWPVLICYPSIRTERLNSFLPVSYLCDWPKLGSPSSDCNTCEEEPSFQPRAAGEITTRYVNGRLEVYLETLILFTYHASGGYLPTSHRRGPG